MKLVIVAALALVACAAAAPAESEPVPIVRSDFDQQADGAYKFSYETGDGTNKEETGELKSLTNEKNEPVEAVVVRGSYSYTDPEGVKHTVTYTADETGFHAEYEPKA